MNRCGALQSILASSAIPKIPCSLLVLFELVRGSGILGNAVAVWLQSASSHRCGREAPAARLRAPARLVAASPCTPRAQHGSRHRLPTGSAYHQTQSCGEAERQQLFWSEKGALCEALLETCGDLEWLVQHGNSHVVCLEASVSQKIR